MTIDFLMGAVCLLFLEILILTALSVLNDIKKNNETKEIKETDKQTPPPSPQSYWTGKNNKKIFTPKKSKSLPP